MKTTFKVLAFIVIIASKGTLLTAQNTVTVFDTIRIEEANYNELDFIINDTIIDALYINTSGAVLLGDVHFKFGSGLLGDMVTSATGINLSGSKETDFYLASDLATNDTNLNWKYDVYCPGYVEKNRSRAINSDGSTSVETTYSNVYVWDDGSIGYIIEDMDTIGWSYIHMQPRMDSLKPEWLNNVYKGKPESNHSSREFAMIGEFTGKDLKIVNNTDEDRIYIIKEDTITGIYQIQKPPKMAFKKKNRKVYQPYLLVNDQLSEWERIDVLRLAMVGVRMWRLVKFQY